MEVSDSRLSRQEHWDETFEQELKNFEEFHDSGYIWYGKDCQEAIVNYILSKYPSLEPGRPDTHPYVLDVGTGNGALLFKLAEKGLRRLKGIDYSPTSVRFARTVRQDDPKLYGCIEFEVQNVFELVESDKNMYDIIHDKGTFDVVYMNKELDNKEYARAIRHRLNAGNPASLLIISSCNLTDSELDEIFVDAEEGSLFEKVEEIKQPHKRFQFGGVTGQSVTTDVYRIPKENPHQTNYD
jgi:2-polyprenyl-3-methyl-5-hydroxy-6-metoxy-1,4-benzoquinol methylase